VHNRDTEQLDRLMARLAEGDRSAFDPLFRALYPRARGMARARLGAELASDAAQSALERVFARADEFTPGRPVLPWFYAIVANEVRCLARRHAPAGGDDVDTAEIEPGTTEDPERLLIKQERISALDQVIASLDGPSAEAIVAVLGRGDRPPIGADAFRKRVSRVYARLRSLLGDDHGG
jgi:RNA polymerase sigma-70 factor (ECF subfamily)